MSYINRIKIPLLFIVIIFILTSCTQNTLNNDNFLGLKVSSSKKDQVINKLGEPLNIHINGMITYIYYENGMSLILDTATEKLIGYNISSSFITEQGLKIGDSIDKMFEIYGEIEPAEEEIKTKDNLSNNSGIDWDNVHSIFDVRRIKEKETYIYENEKSKLTITIIFYEDDKNEISSIKYIRKDLYPL